MQRLLPAEAAALRGSGLALSVTFGDRLPLLSLHDIFPRSGGSLSSKGEPRALPETYSLNLIL